MSYIARYEKFINALKDQQIVGRYERHHIVPKSLGGDNSKSNIIKLTYRQHYIAHWMLWKIHSGKMANAFFFMNQAVRYKRIGSRGYEKLRKEASEFSSKVQKGREFPQHRKEKMKEIAKKHMQNPEARENLRQHRLKQVIPKEAYERQAKVISSLVWMNDNKRSYRVKPENVELKLNDGFVIGRLINYINDDFKKKRKEIASLQWSALKATGHTGNLKRI